MDPTRCEHFSINFPTTICYEAFQLFLDADARLKGGSGGHPARILEDVLLRLCDRAQVSTRPPHRVVGPSHRNR